MLAAAGTVAGETQPIRILVATDTTSRPGSCTLEGSTDRLTASRNAMNFQHVCTHNDRNGNPRRLFVLCLNGTRIAQWEEGYLGLHCVPANLQKFAADAERVDVPPSLYFELRRGLPSPDPEMLKVCATINGQLAAV